MPITLAAYAAKAQASSSFRSWLDGMIEVYPELFPAGIEQGYVLPDILPVAVKLPAVQVRRIKLRQGDGEGKAQVFSIVSSEVLPYMTGYTNEVEKALFLRRFGVPFWRLSYVFGRDDNCVRGLSLALAADEVALTQAYADFRHEAQRLDPGYTPKTVNSDGWSATQNAWQPLFPTSLIIECFLHAFSVFATAARASGMLSSRRSSRKCGIFIMLAMPTPSASAAQPCSPRRNTP